MRVGDWVAERAIIASNGRNNDKIFGNSHFSLTSVGYSIKKPVEKRSATHLSCLVDPNDR